MNFLVINTNMHIYRWPKILLSRENTSPDCSLSLLPSFFPFNCHEHAAYKIFGRSHCWLVYEETQCSLLSQDSKGIDAGLATHIFQEVVSMSGHHFHDFAKVHRAVDWVSIWCNVRSISFHEQTVLRYKLQGVDLSLSERWCQKGESKIGVGKLCKPDFGNFERTSETVKNEYFVIVLEF